jgi:hypothetical protein
MRPDKAVPGSRQPFLSIREPLKNGMFIRNEGMQKIPQAYCDSFKDGILSAGERMRENPIFKRFP